MAEIDIKKKINIWPWIIAAIVVLAVILYFVFNNDDSRDGDKEQIGTEPVGVLEDFAHPGTDTVYLWDENSTNNI